MPEYEYNIIKCHPNLLEEKLNEEGKKGWKFSFLTGEQQNHALTGKQIFLLVLIFYRIIDNKTE